jgi:AcrR family transcriptional regulator
MNKGDDTKISILNEAVQLASVHGLQGLTIGGLAQQVHLSKGGLCAHFPSKQSLQLAVIDHAANIFERAVVLPTLTTPSGQARLLALGEAWFEYLQQPVFLGGCFFTNAVLEVDDLADQDVRASVLRYYQRFLAFIQREVHAAVQQGQIHPAMMGEHFDFAFVGILLGTLVWRGLGQQREGIRQARQALTLLLQSEQG